MEGKLLTSLAAGESHCDPVILTEGLRCSEAGLTLRVILNWSQGCTALVAKYCMRSAASCSLSLKQQRELFSEGMHPHLLVAGAMDQSIYWNKRKIPEIPYNVGLDV